MHWIWCIVSCGLKNEWISVCFLLIIYLLMSVELNNFNVFMYSTDFIFTILQWFYDGTPLSKEIVTTLRHKWAGYFLQIKNSEVRKI